MSPRVTSASLIDPEKARPLRCFAILLMVFPLLCSASVLLAEGRFEDGSSALREEQVAQKFEVLRQNPVELRAFFLGMPKGGDIHNHLTGAVYAEYLIDQASDEDLCINLDNYTVSANYCGAENSEPVKDAYSSSKLYGQIVDAWSMRDSELLDESSHDHFFDTFGVFGGATSNTSALLAYIRSSAYLENISYLEVMTGAGSAAANLGGNVGWDDNLSRLYDKLVDNGLDSVSQSLCDYINGTESGSLSILENEGDPGRNVTVRYILAATRSLPCEKVFGQLAAAFDAANRSNLAVGVNLLSAEDNWNARENYSLQMEMVGFLHSIYPNVNIALHAGELNLGLVPPDDLRFHIKEAVGVARASRIGHGVDIMWELHSDQTLEEMAEDQIAIEIMPVSNQLILGVGGKDHPFPVYFDRGVPIVLASDDPGVLRTDLSEQFVVIAEDYPQVKYQDFKKFVRNSIEYSFLSGNSIWASKGDYTKLADECSCCQPGSEETDSRCSKFLYSSEKARAEWKLEAYLAAFEERYSGGEAGAQLQRSDAAPLYEPNLPQPRQRSSCLDPCRDRAQDYSAIERCRTGCCA
ncbi:MAG: adenosine deaminase [Methanotrichaceae archaeon]|nr:adenosine deaminase [Methanotrichaceae archaeon]